MGGPVALIALAMRRVHYPPDILAAEESVKGDGRSWYDLWGIPHPRQGPR